MSAVLARGLQMFWNGSQQTVGWAAIRCLNPWDDGWGA